VIPALYTSTALCVCCFGLHDICGSGNQTGGRMRVERTWRHRNTQTHAPPSDDLTSVHVRNLSALIGP
jgi:hypothetical protein